MLPHMPSIAASALIKMQEELFVALVAERAQVPLRL
jgi:hypothetical protein